MKLLVKNGLIINPANNMQERCDLLLDEGRIAQLGPELNAADAEVVDVTGKLVCPGFIDMHVHLREPGFEYKEDIVSGTKAAAAGGFTTICCMPNTDPVVDNAAVALFIKDRAHKAGVVNVLPIGAITKKQAGQELTEMAELIAAGCVAVSDDGKPLERSDMMRHALDYAKMFDLPVLSHCEDTALSTGGQMHEGYYSIISGFKGIPAAAEEIMAARDIILAAISGARLHICHISTAGGVELVRKAKQEGLRVTCEVTPHHLLLTDAMVKNYDANTKVNPPLRSADHVEALRQALADGTIDCISTDHAPQHRESKECEFDLAAFGISGLETAIPLTMQLVEQKYLDIMEWVRLFTAGPAEILNLPIGTLTPGEKADITIIDPEAVKKVDPEKFYSKGKNNPCAGMELKGWPYMTIVNGKIVFGQGVVL